jgi:hypothetical protein
MIISAACVNQHLTGHAMPSQPIRDIVIIGGGASAALVAWNLRRHHGLTCTIVAPSDRPSFGLAYSTPSLKNLLNVTAGGMSADPEEPHHFLEWMRGNVSPQTTADTFVPAPFSAFICATSIAWPRPNMCLTLPSAAPGMAGVMSSAWPGVKRSGRAMWCWPAAISRLPACAAFRQISIPPVAIITMHGPIPFSQASMNTKRCC